MTEHKIEEMAKVYLIEEGGRWVIDSVTMDGYGLDGYENGALNEACECDDPEDCEAARKAAQELSMPSGQDLFQLMAEYLGVSLPPVYAAAA